MRLKSFYAPTLTEAMSAVKKALGDNALIVATSDDEENDLVRVTAAIDKDYLEEKERIEPSLPSLDIPEGSDAIEVLAEVLIKENVPFELSERILAIAAQVVNDDIHACLSKALKGLCNFSEFNLNAPSMIVGTMGSGKTLSLIKMAAESVLEERSVSVISMDTERTGANAQLEAITDIMETKFIQIHDASALKDILKVQFSNLRNNEVFYIDTPGINIFDKQEKDYLKSIVNSAKTSDQHINIFLAIPASMEVSIAREIINEFHEIGAIGIILTGTDLLCQMGNLLRLASNSPIGLCLYSGTRKITEKLGVLNADTAADLILRRGFQ